MKITVFASAFYLHFQLLKCANFHKIMHKAMAKTVMTIWKDSMTIRKGKPAKWTYDQGVILKGIEGLWKQTGDRKIF